MKLYSLTYPSAKSMAQKQAYYSQNNALDSAISFSAFFFSKDIPKINYNDPIEKGKDTELGKQIEKLNDSIKKIELELDKTSNINARKILIDNLHFYKKQLFENRNDLFSRHIPFVLSFAPQYTCSSYTIDEAISSGCFGLFKATKNWKPSLFEKADFIQYAKLWIDQEIKRDKIKRKYQVSRPIGVLQKSGRIINATEKLKEYLGRTPTPEEIGNECNLSAKTVNWILRDISFKEQSLNAPISNFYTETDSNSFSELFADKNQEKRLQNILDKDDIRFFLDLIEKLPEKERDIIKSRYGLYGKNYKYSSYRELGKKYHLTHERIRQIENDILKYLFKKYERFNFYDYNTSNLHK